MCSSDLGQVTVASVQSDPSKAGKTVTFDGFGRVTNSDAISQIDITGTGSSVNLRLAVSSAGLVRMCDPRVSDINDPRKC